MALLRRTPLRERFWQKVDRRGPDECWEWTASRRCGYGQIARGGQNSPVDHAHRVSYELHHGPIPEGMFVCHRCDNRGCVNPAHLYAGTREDNTRDAHERNRFVRGETHHSSKLNADAVRDIRKRRTAGEQLKPIAADYGIDFRTVYDVAAGRRWRWLDRWIDDDLEPDPEPAPYEDDHGPLRPV